MAFHPPPRRQRRAVKLWLELSRKGKENNASHMEKLSLVLLTSIQFTHVVWNRQAGAEECWQGYRAIRKSKK